jgi:hypothetical protein
VIPANVIETVAMVSHAAIREMGIAAGEPDCPTWQILPGDRKIQYRRAAQAALLEIAPMAGDPLLERMASMAYARWSDQQEVEQPTWEGLSRGSRLHWQMVVAMARVMVMNSGQPVVALQPAVAATKLDGLRAA